MVEPCARLATFRFRVSEFFFSVGSFFICSFRVSFFIYFYFLIRTLELWKREWLAVVVAAAVAVVVMRG